MTPGGHPCQAGRAAARLDQIRLRLHRYANTMAGATLRDFLLGEVDEQLARYQQQLTWQARQDAGTRVDWPEDGPPVERPAEPHGHPRYRKPTLTHAGTVPAGAMIADRADYLYRFAFTEPDGTRVSYHGVVPQDVLFRLLHDAGMLERDVQR